MGWGLLSREIMEPKNEDQLRKSVAATAIIGCILSLFVIFIGAVGLFPLLQFLGTPSAIVSQSYLYIATIVNGVAVTLPIIFVPDFFERLAIA